MNDDYYDTTAMIRHLLKRAEAGEVKSFAMRLFHEDGTFEDVVAGGTEEERKELLAKLHAKTDLQQPNRD